MFKSVIGSALIAGSLAGGLALAAPANAEYSAVCQYLDNHPNDAGVVVVGKVAMNQVGLSPRQAAEAIYGIVSESCAWNIPVLIHFANSYS